jgi:hypothetical protein
MAKARQGDRWDARSKSADVFRIDVAPSGNRRGLSAAKWARWPASSSAWPSDSAGIGSAVLGALADRRGIQFVFQVCSYLPLIGLLTALLPNLTSPRRRFSTAAGARAGSAIFANERSSTIFKVIAA